MKTLKRKEVYSYFKVWNPRWHDRKALLMDFKLGLNNVIEFPKADSLPGLYYIAGRDVKKYPTEPFVTKRGHTVRMRVVPLDDLETLEFVDA